MKRITCNLLIIACVLCTWGIANAGSMTCNAPNGVRVESWALTIGARPYKGLKVGAIKWFFKKTLLQQIERYHQSPSKGTELLTAVWDFKTKKVLKSIPKRRGYATRYQIEVRLKRKDGKSIHPQLKTSELKLVMTCLEQHRLIP